MDLGREGEGEIEGIGITAGADEDEEVVVLDTWLVIDCSSCCQNKKLSTSVADWDRFVLVVVIELLSVARGRTTAVA